MTEIGPENISRPLSNLPKGYDRTYGALRLDHRIDDIGEYTLQGVQVSMGKTAGCGACIACKTTRQWARP